MIVRDVETDARRKIFGGEGEGHVRVPAYRWTVAMVSGWAMVVYEGPVRSVALPVLRPTRVIAGFGVKILVLEG